MNQLKTKFLKKTFQASLSPHETTNPASFHVHTRNFRFSFIPQFFQSNVLGSDAWIDKASDLTVTRLASLIILAASPELQICSTT